MQKIVIFNSKHFYDTDSDNVDNFISFKFRFVSAPGTVIQSIILL